MKSEKFKDQNMLKNKKLLLLGGSRNDIEFIKYAHEMGVKVGVTDWYDTNRSPAKLYADEYFNVSISDINELDKLIKENGYDGVLTGFTDSYLEYYVDLCEKSNLYCYGTKDNIKKLTHKDIYKDLFIKYKVPTLRNYEPEEIDNNFNDYPIVIKPVDGSGGNGLKIVRNFEEFNEALSQSKDKSKISKVIIEPYIENRKELTAFFVFVDGQVYYPGSANRFLSKAQGEKIGLPVLYTLQSSEDDNFRKNVLPNMTNMFKDMEVKNGILFAQCIIDDDQIYVYDLGYRTTGTLEYKLFDKIYGTNTMKMLINHALTGTMDMYGIKDYQKIFETDKIACNLTILGKEGIVKDIKGVDEIKSMDKIIDFQIKTAPGDEITSNMIGTLGQIIGRVFFVCNNLDEVIDIISRIYDKVDVIDDKNNNMILDTIDKNDILEMYNRQYHG